MSLNALKARIARQKAERQAKHDAELKAQVAAKLATEQAPNVVSTTTKVLAEEPLTHTVTEHVEPLVHTAKQLNKDEVDVSMFNGKQALAVTLASMGKSFNLIGAAGSGKTTTVRGVITTLRDSGIIGKLDSGTDKVLSAGAPSVAVLSYTNQAVRNIKEALPKEFKAHCSTIHKILEYAPEYDEVEALDEQGNWTGEYKKTMYYEPTYGTEPNSGHGKGGMLPMLDVVIVEEAGSVPTDLWETFLSALPHAGKNTIFIKLGDLNQLPPVFGDGILGYSLLERPIVELNQVYRNVGLVTQFAHRILEGKPISCDELANKWSLSDESGTLKFNAFKRKNDPKVATPTLGKHFQQLVIDGKFDTENDVLLIPFNKQLGTDAMNKWLNSGLDKKLGRTVHEVMAGYLKSYWAVGDKVLFNKQYCRIISIEENTSFRGDPVLQPSKHLNRWGYTTKEYEFRTPEQQVQAQAQSVEQMLDEAYEDLEEGGTVQASSIFVLEATDEALRNKAGELPTYEVNSAGQVNSMLPVLAMSVHKSQGSEWRKVWMILHHSHAVMFQRELLYTGVTRARQDLEVFYSGTKTSHKIGGSPFQMGIINQQIAGKTIEHKLKYFKDKVNAKRTSEAILAGRPIPQNKIEPLLLTEDYNLESLPNE